MRRFVGSLQPALWVLAKLAMLYHAKATKAGSHCRFPGTGQEIHSALLDSPEPGRYLGTTIGLTRIGDQINMKGFSMNLSDCPCLGRNLDKLVQPAILALLTERSMHGYALAGQIGRMPVCRGDVPNPTGVYRFLKSMQRRGLVSSEWDSAKRGPQRKIYQITEDGRACLEHWIGALEPYRRGIDALIRLAKKSLSHSRT